MVEVARRYSNRHDILDELTATWLQLQREQDGTATPDPPGTYTSACRNQRTRPLTVRLSPAEIDQLVVDYLAGTTARELAARHQVSLTALKRLLQARGARRRPKAT